MLASHYAKGMAFLQKVSALANRSETQSRDVFDLKLLIDAGAAPAELKDDQIEVFRAASERAMGVRFEEFTAQVVAHFRPRMAGVLFRKSAAWDGPKKPSLKLCKGSPDETDGKH